MGWFLDNSGPISTAGGVSETKASGVARPDAGSRTSARPEVFRWLRRSATREGVRLSEEVLGGRGEMAAGIAGVDHARRLDQDDMRFALG